MNPIATDVYHIPVVFRNIVNCYIVEGVLIDSGLISSFNKISKHIKEIPVYEHALTHAHPDHQGCSDKICEEFNVPLSCHIKETVDNVTLDYPSDSLIFNIQRKYLGKQGHKVDKTLKENDMLGNFRIVETPGHSDGHISFFREKDGVLILGDAAKNMSLLTSIRGLDIFPKFIVSNMNENIKSLRKVAQLNPRIICFGHGPVLFNDNHQFEKFVRRLKID